MMRRSCVFRSLMLLVLSILIAGCGESSKSTSKPATPAEKKPRTIDVAGIAALGDPLPPLDEGRIEISPPDGWHLPSRSSEYVVRFQSSRKGKYPSIYVTAEDYETIFDVSESTAEAFAKQRAAALTAEGVTLIKEVTPLRIGNNWGIAYMKQGKDKGSIVDQMFFETVVGGRKYKYETRMLTGDIPKVQSKFFAVIGNTKFLRPPPSEKPAEEASDKPDTKEAP